MSRYVSMYLVAVHLLAYSECEPVGCGPGTTGPGIDACVMCESGKYKGINGASECVACESPMFLSSNRRSCTALPELNHSLALCETCVPGKASKPFDNNMRCEDCERGKSQSRSGQLSCSTCAVGKYSDEVAQTSCVPCALCDVGDYRDGCGDGSHASSGECTSCLIECAEGMMVPACINREGVVGKAPVCKHKEFLTRTPLCQIDRTTKLVDRGLGLGGFDFETIFGGNENEVDFQCSRVCDARGEDGGTVDTMMCDGPFACNRKACSMESSYLDTDLNEFLVGRACPVELSMREKAEPLVHVDSVNRKRRASCQKCSECGSTGALVETHGLRDWGRGCASECSKVECDIGEIFDWTDHLCKPCAQLSNVSLCAYDQTVQDSLAVQDVSGYRAKILFTDCHVKGNRERSDISYGRCECCRVAHQSTDCSAQTAAASYHAGCNTGCVLCLHKQDRVLTSSLMYVTVTGSREPLYCQLRECAQDSNSRQKTGLKDLGAMCVSSCLSKTCESHEVQLECTLPHNTRCRKTYPEARRGQHVVGHVPAHANLFEHPDSAKYQYSSFENVLVNVDALHDGDKHQCVWNAADIRDNDMNPAGVSFTFFPPAKSYAYELTEYGSKFCHLWQRSPHLWYPLLPLQNTVSFDSAFPRRLLLNASARVMHYEYSGAGHGRVPDQLRLERPSAFANTFTGDLYLTIDLLNTPNATLAIMVPDDRRLREATWIPSLLFSALVADATARSTVERPALLVRATVLASTRRESFRLSVSLAAAAQHQTVSNFAGVHCEPSLCRFSVPAAHTGFLWVSKNTLSVTASPLSGTFPEMLLAQHAILGNGFYQRSVGPNPPATGVISRIRSSPHTSTCHLLAVVDSSSLVCFDLRGSSAGTPVAFGSGDVLRIESTSRIVDLCVVGANTLVVLQLSSGDGQQILTHNPDTQTSLDVDYIPDDVVAVASNSLADSDSVWVLRKLKSESDRQLTLERRSLRVRDPGNAAMIHLFDTNDTLVDILRDVFVGDPNIALSETDTYEVSVSETNSVFVLFGLVGAERRIIRIYEHHGGQMTPACTLVSQFPGLDTRLVSSAWISERKVLMHFQDHMYSASCEDGRLRLTHEAETSLPNNPFVSYAGSYLSLASGALLLYSHIDGVSVATDHTAAGFCAFVSTPQTTLEVERHVNAHMRSAVVVVDSDFATEQLVEYEQGGVVKRVHSLRALTPVGLFVEVTPTPASKLRSNPLYTYMAALDDDNSFWDATAEHFMDIQASLPCSASLVYAGHTFQSDATVCANVQVVVQVVVHVRIMESWSSTRSLAFVLVSGDIYTKGGDGAVTHTTLSDADMQQGTSFRLYHGAVLTQMHEVEHLSSVQFHDEPSRPLAACETCRWQRVRYLTSAHAVAAAQPMLVQVIRPDEALESWSTQRSVAVDALQLLVVLTSAVARVRPETHTGDRVVVPVSLSSGWLPGRHCCESSAGLQLGLCSVGLRAPVTDIAQCAYMTEYMDRPCVAKTFLGWNKECHCHSTCAHTDMRETTETNVFLMIGSATPFCKYDMLPIDYSSADRTQANCGCRPGKFQATAGATQCQDCAPGKSKSSVSGGCVLCKAGTYANTPGNAACSPCQMNSDSHEGALFCLCAAGYYLLEGRCEQCPENTYKNTVGDGVCYPCPLKSQSVLGSTVAEMCYCDAGYTEETPTAACRECGLGKYSVHTNFVAETPCVNCPTGKQYYGYGGTSAENCSPCEKGKIAPQEGTGECANCAAGKYLNAEEGVACNECSTGTHALEGATTCALCASGHQKSMLGESATEDCAQCARGKSKAMPDTVLYTYYSDLGSNLQDMTCQACEVGFFQDNPGSVACNGCPAFTSTITSGAILSAECVCQPGYTRNGVGSDICAACIAGKFKGGKGDQACSDCGTGTHSSGTGSIACTDCLSGKYAALTGHTECDPCEAGKFVASDKADVCVSCPLDTYNPETGASLQTDCELCVLHSASTQETVSVEGCICNAGYYQDTVPAGSEWTCLECPTGTFRTAAETQATECVGCDAGKYQQHTGKQAETDCVDCEPGTISPEPSSEACAACPSLKIAALPGLTICSDCSVGLFNGAEGQSRCVLCAKSYDTYNDNTNACQKCSPGTFKGVTGNDACADCTAGTYTLPEAREQCETCFDNSQSDTASDSIEECVCNVGYYRRTTETGGSITYDCLECISGTYQDTSTRNPYLETTHTECSVCNSGTFSETGAEACQDCTAGTFSNYLSINCHRRFILGLGPTTLFGGVSTSCTHDNGLPPQCVPCATGRYQDEEGKSICDDCPEFTYADERGSTQCKTCAAGKYGQAKTSVKTESDTCIQCEEGKYNPDAGQSVCTLCPAGKYNTIRGGSSSQACNPCTSGFSSPTRRGCSDIAVSLTCAGDMNDEKPLVQNLCHCQAQTDTFVEIQALDNSDTYPADMTCSWYFSGVGDPVSQSVLLVFESFDTRSPEDTVTISGCNNKECSDAAVLTHGTLTGQLDLAGLFQIVTFERYVTTSRKNVMRVDFAVGSRAGTQGMNWKMHATVQPFTNCPSGTYSDLESKFECVTCIAGYFSAGGFSHECSPCLPGHYSPSAGAGECEACPNGKFQANGASEACEFCQVGESSVPVAISCFSCDSGKSSTYPHSQCTGCAAGKHTVGDSRVCSMCDKGKYKTGISDILCQDCPAGKATDALGSSECTSCLAGEHQPLEGQQFCEWCDNGESSTQGSLSCTQCESGKISGHASDYLCTICQAGSQNNSENTYCDECSLHTYNPTAGGQCVDCPSGHYTTENAQTDLSSCLPCGIGEELHETYGICVNCPGGKYNPNTGQQCDACALGKYSSTTISAGDGATVCSECQANLYPSSDQSYCGDEGVKIECMTTNDAKCGCSEMQGHIVEYKSEALGTGRGPINCWYTIEATGKLQVDWQPTADHVNNVNLYECDARDDDPCSTPWPISSKSYQSMRLGKEGEAQRLTRWRPNFVWRFSYTAWDDLDPTNIFPTRTPGTKFALLWQQDFYGKPEKGAQFTVLFKNQGTRRRRLLADTVEDSEERDFTEPVTVPPPVTVPAPVTVPPPVAVTAPVAADIPENRTGRRLHAAAQASAAVLYAPMYVPTMEELAQIDLAHVVHGSNDAHTDDWQRVFVLVGLESSHAAGSMRDCAYRVRVCGLGAWDELLASPDISQLRALGCTLRLDGHGVGECHLAVPTSLALVGSRRLVALTAEVVVEGVDSPALEQARCEWPDRDLFTASLVPYATKLTCAHEHFWSEDALECVSCELGNSELVANVCDPGHYIRGCDAISHLNSAIADECQACPDNGNPAHTYEWRDGVCQWQCVAGFFLDPNTRCVPCTSMLETECGTAAGLRWQTCSATANEACVPCPPIQSGLYTMNEEFLAADASHPAECQTVCKEGHYRNSDDNYCRVCTSAQNLQVQLDLQYGAGRDFYRFVSCAGAQDSVSDMCDPSQLSNGMYTGDATALDAPCPFECEEGYHALEGGCIACATPQGVDGTFLPANAFVFSTQECDYECRAEEHYVLRNASSGLSTHCVLCNPSICGVGHYLTGSTCLDCPPCASTSLTGGIFSSHGELDSPASCTETCPPHFFADFDRCLPHSTIECASDEYLLDGTGAMDTMCQSCAQCQGQRLLQACGSHSNSVCEACPPLRANEVYTDAQCTAACVSGALRDSTGACELCATVCQPGAFRNFSTGHNCSQCTPCPELPAHGTYTDECAWVCATGHTFSARASACVLETPNDVPTAPAVRRILCTNSEFLNAAYECRPCSDLEVPTPDAEGLGVRWRWKVWGDDICAFECIGQYYQYSRADGSRFCYTDTEYTAHVLLLNHQLSPVFLALAHTRPPDPAASGLQPASTEPDRLDSTVVFLCAAFVIIILLASIFI